MKRQGEKEKERQKNCNNSKILEMNATFQVVHWITFYWMNIIMSCYDWLGSFAAIRLESDKLSNFQS